MPDPITCLLAVLAAAGTSAIVVLVLGGPGRPASAARINAATIAGVGAGLAAGYGVLQIQPEWPPATGLERFLTIVLPAVIGVELLAVVLRLPQALTLLLRAGLAISTARILLHDSVYLRGAGDEPTWRVPLLLALGGTVLAAEWGLLLRLNRRAPGVSLPLALAASLVCGGAAIMLAGYLAGGEATLPPAAALAGAALASAGIGRSAAPGTIGIGLLALFGLLFLGRFFGAVPTGQGLTVLLAPLACWAAEHPAVKNRRPWATFFLRWGLIAVPLIVVLMLAKRNFERGLGRLMSVESATSAQSGELANVKLPVHGLVGHAWPIALGRLRQAGDENGWPSQAPVMRWFSPCITVSTRL
ncbi:MAG TPA: hypothetical protein VG826_21820 [Pirellulales bacterium]|nr:hypothetical protein [Pirellulales bacterium]